MTRTALITRRTLTLAKAGAGLQEAAKASGVFWKQEREFLRQATRPLGRLEAAVGAGHGRGGGAEVLEELGEKGDRIRRLVLEQAGEGVAGPAGACGGLRPMCEGCRAASGWRHFMPPGSGKLGCIPQPYNGRCRQC